MEKYTPLKLFGIVIGIIVLGYIGQYLFRSSMPMLFWLYLGVIIGIIVIIMVKQIENSTKPPKN